MICFDEILREQQNTAVALGYFDGVHMGHRDVLMPAAAQRANGLLPVCLTFSQSPKSVISGQKIPAVMTRDDKVKALDNLGIAHTCFADFRQLMHLSAEDFVRKILAGKLNAKKLFCGFNYRFGKNAEGNTETLKRLCEELGIELTVVPPKKIDGEVVSSTLIKQLIANGEIEKANTLLCGRFGFSDTVAHGRRLGRELGTPTINQPLSDGLIVPKFGVYASAVTLEDGGVFCGVTNVGIKPTVGSKTPLWETWMPKYHGGEIYGQHADVRLLSFIRPERKFQTLTDLKNEIVVNGKTALALFDMHIQKSDC